MHDWSEWSGTSILVSIHPEESGVEWQIQSKESADDMQSQPW